MIKHRNNSGLFFKLVVVLLAVGALFFFMPKKVKDNHAIPEKESSTPVISATTPVTSFQSGETEFKAAVLMYHHIGDLPNGADEIRRGLTVSSEEFEQQIKYLKENNYQLLSLEKFDLLKEKKQVPEKAVILTFDDGYDDNFNVAFPIMKKYDATGTFFIITGKIGMSEYMSEQQIQEMSAAGNEIGSHTVNHLSLEKYKGAQLKSEITKSKDTLEKIIAKKVISFCYPAGKYNEETVKAVEEAGYKYAVTTRSSTGILDLNNRLEIPRYRISSGRNIEAMLK